MEATGGAACGDGKHSATPAIIALSDASNCSGPRAGTVSVSGWNFQPGATVRIELLSGNLATVMDTRYATIDQNGYLLAQEPPYSLPYVLNLTSGYSGPAAVVVDEYYPYNQETWTGVAWAC